MQPLIELADRFDVSNNFRIYLNRVITQDIQTNSSCVICLNAFVLAMEQGLSMPKKPVSFFTNKTIIFLDIFPKLYFPTIL